MRSQVLSGNKSRPLAYDVACVTFPHAACYSFLQPQFSASLNIIIELTAKNSAAGGKSGADHPSTTVVPPSSILISISSHCLWTKGMFSEIYLRNLPLFRIYLSDLRLTHSPRAEYTAEVFGSSAGRLHIRMTSSKHDACSLDLQTNILTYQIRYFCTK